MSIQLSQWAFDNIMHGILAQMSECIEFKKPIPASLQEAYDGLCKAGNDLKCGMGVICFVNIEEAGR